VQREGRGRRAVELTDLAGRGAAEGLRQSNGSLDDRRSALMPIHYSRTTSHQESVILLDRFFQLASGGSTVLAFTAAEPHVPLKVLALRNHWAGAYAAALSKGIGFRRADGLQTLKSFFVAKGHVGVVRSSGQRVIGTKAFCELVAPSGLSKVDSLRWHRSYRPTTVFHRCFSVLIRVLPQVLRCDRCRWLRRDHLPRACDSVAAALQELSGS
jgi:hypothetical protein